MRGSSGFIHKDEAKAGGHLDHVRAADAGSVKEWGLTHGAYPTGAILTVEARQLEIDQAVTREEQAETIAKEYKDWANSPGLNAPPPYTERVAAAAQAAQMSGDSSLASVNHYYNEGLRAAEQQVRDRLTVESALGGLDNTLYSLGEAVDALEKILGPILRPEPTSPVKDGIEANPGESAVTAQIWTASGRVSNKAQRIRELIDRIDL